MAHADSLAAADRLLAAAAAEVWLVDRRLPDGDGIDWLATRLAATGDRIPRCLVTSGEQVDPDSLPPGVAGLRKPLDLDALAAWLAQSAVAVAVDLAPGDLPPLLDDERTLARFGGNLAALRSLRGMLLAELEGSAGGVWWSSLEPFAGQLSDAGISSGFPGGRVTSTRQVRSFHFRRRRFWVCRPVTNASAAPGDIEVTVVPLDGNFSASRGGLAIVQHQADQRAPA